MFLNRLASLWAFRSPTSDSGKSALPRYCPGGLAGSQCLTKINRFMEFRLKLVELPEHKKSPDLSE
jgi:hypothetical protein